MSNPRVRRRRAITAGVLAVAVALLGWHYWALYSAATGAKADLESAEQALTGDGFDFTAADVDSASRDLRSARRQVDSARRHARFDPFLATARVLPGTRDQANGIYDMLDMAATLTRIGEQAADAAEVAVRYRDNPRADQPLTRSLIDMLDETAPQIDTIDQLSRDLVRQRRELGDQPLLGPLARVRDRLDEELPRIANSVEQARQARGLLPGFLGFEGERRYLLLALNNEELLPGGGLVTSSGIMPVSNGVNGTLEFVDSTTWKARWEATGGHYIEPPGPLKRYLLRDFTWNLLVSNWTPDYTSWAQTAREFHEMVEGPQQVDGIVAVDLIVLERLLNVTGPKTIPVTGYGDVTFTPSNAVLQLEALTRQAFDPSEDRKSVVGDLAREIVADMLHLPSEKWADAINAVSELGEQRHVQVFSYRPEEQTVLRDIGWDGRLNPTRGDFLHFSEASVLSTKLNLIVKPEGTYTVDVSPLGDARHELTLRYANPFSKWAADKPPALVSQLMLGGLYGGYLRVFGPSGLSNPAVEIDGQPGNVEDTGTESGRDWFGTLLSLPADSSRTVTFRWTVAAAGTGSAYRLFIQKQAGTEGMCLALNILREGRPASDVHTSGGTRAADGRTCLTTDVTVTARFD